MSKSDALDMSLDDVIKSHPKGGKSSYKGSKSSGKGGKDSSSEAKVDKKEVEVKLDMSLDDVIDQEFNPRKGKGKGKSKDKGKGKDKGDSWSSWSGYSGGAKEWNGGGATKDWDTEKPWKASGGGGGWGGGSSSWGGAAKSDEWKDSSWKKDEPWKSSGEKGGDSWSSGGGRGGGRPAGGREEWEGGGKRGSPWEDDRRDAGGREAGREAGRSTLSKRPRQEEAGGRPETKKIRVSNLPRDLDWRDIKDAFENEAGTIVRCEVIGTDATISFVRSGDARKAVDTFDRGELNGRTISVRFD